MPFNSSILDTLKSKYVPNTKKFTNLPTGISSERIAKVLCIFLQYLQVSVILAVMLLNPGIRHMIKFYS